jgi:uncharacterized small protein (DUF1192 family)
MFDDDSPRPKRQIVMGEDLYGYSVEELEERIDRLKGEIDRVAAELKSKKSGLAAADSLFSR